VKRNDALAEPIGRIPTNPYNHAATASLLIGSKLSNPQSVSYYA
jgi:hypothetical protein